MLPLATVRSSVRSSTALKPALSNSRRYAFVCSDSVEGARSSGQAWDMAASVARTSWAASEWGEGAVEGQPRGGEEDVEDDGEEEEGS